MATNMKNAQELLFGTSGLGASNFKMFLGFNRDATPEAIAGDLVASLNEVLAGDAEEFTLDDEAAFC